MNYSQSLHYLNSFLNLERIIFSPHNRLWNLRRMRLLLDWFDHPEKSFFPVLIAGTKGKGSTGFFLESILNRARIPTGFYSSPHLEDPRERIRIRGRMISKAEWARAADQIKRILDKKKLPEGLDGLTYFESLTLMAALIFKKAGVKAGIFEVGMGGRLDATNALGARVVVLTPIHLDHEAVLGNTIAKIAAEKAGVIHRGADVISSPQFPEARRVIQARIRKEKAFLHPVLQKWNGRIGLLGDFQRINAAAAAGAAEILRRRFSIPDPAVREGLQASHWPGRMELFRKALGKSDLLLDGAHNPASVEALVKSLRHSSQSGISPGLARNGVLIFGTSRDKNSALMLKMLGSLFKEVILCRNPNPRSQEIGILISQARPWFRRIYPAPDVPQALQLARRLAAGRPAIATGSFYLIGEIRKRIGHHARHQTR